MNILLQTIIYKINIKCENCKCSDNIIFIYKCVTYSMFILIFIHDYFWILKIKKKVKKCFKWKLYDISDIMITHDNCLK